MTRRLPQSVVDRAVAGSSLEWKLTDRHAFGLTTATDVQRALCRVADGQPLRELALSAEVKAALRSVDMPLQKPKEVFVLSGIRTAKSLTAACGAFHMAMTCDVSSLRVGEVPRVSVVSLKKDLGDVVMNHLVGSVKSSDLLRPFMIGEPRGDGLMLRHPSGCPVEVMVVAGSRAGGSLVARWSAGVIFDEFPRMVGGDDGVVNWDDSRDAAIGRLLNGCQMWHIGSPWAPYGPAYEVVTEHWGHPTPDRVVLRAPATAMNPFYWTPERVESAKRAGVYRTDVLGEFAAPEEALFSSESIDRCTRAVEVIGPRPGNTYYAAMDPATRGNGWTLCIGTREGGKTIIVKACEWRGTREVPLDPGDVLAEIAGILSAYRVTSVHTDQAMGDALVTLARQVGLSLVSWTLNANDRARRYLAIRTRMDSNELELPPIRQMRTDLLHLQKRPTPGGMNIVLPLTGDGRHCDYAPSLMLVLSKMLPEPDRTETKYVDPETRRMREEFLRRVNGNKDW